MSRPHLYNPGGATQEELDLMMADWRQSVMYPDDAIEEPMYSNFARRTRVRPGPRPLDRFQLLQQFVLFG